MLSDTQFILSIKSHEILYNNSRTLSRTDEAKQNKIWATIAQNFKLKSSKEARQKWEKLIQNYIKFLRNGDHDFLPYANEMQFMQPHILSDNSQDSSQSDLEIDDDELQRMLYSDEEGDQSDPPPEKKPRHIENKPIKVKEENSGEHLDSNFETCTYVDTSGSSQLTSCVSNQAVSATSTLNNLSSLELIFLGYAKVLQKMPLALQLQTKRKIAEIMDDAEMKSLEQ